MSRTPEIDDLITIIDTMEKDVEKLKFFNSKSSYAAEIGATTVTVGSTTTGAAGSSASVTNSGTLTAPILNFTIPRGDTGATGPQGPQGPAYGTISVGSVTTGAPGSSASVTNSGTSSAAVFNFTIPRGDKGDTGDSATVAVGTVTTTASGTSANVTNSGSSTAAVLNFSIPRGDKGLDGEDGNTILNGSGAPNFSIGNDGDFYLDTTAGVMYGPKSGGTWPASGFVSTPGPAGPAGSPSVTDARLFYLY